MLVPGEAVLKRGYVGPPDVFERWYNDIVETLEAVFLPASAWLPDSPDDPGIIWAGAAPLLGKRRINAAFVLDSVDNPQLLVGLEEDAGDASVVTFENVSDEDMTVTPAGVSLTFLSMTNDGLTSEEWPLYGISWEDGTETDFDGARVLAPGERATVRLDFVPGDLSAIGCADLPFLILTYTAADDTIVTFADSELPPHLSDCLPTDELSAAAGRPVW
jgi:hypothetical protein